MRAFSIAKGTTMTSITSTARDTQLRRYNDVRDLLPDVDNPSPIVRLNRVGPAAGLDLYLKLEWMNPFGSLKDRTAAYLLAGLRERGELKDKQIIEATSGNTGIALAALGAVAGVDVTVTIPDGVPEEKKVILRMMGAEVWETPDDVCPVDHPKDGAIALARSFVRSAGGDRYSMPNQYENADNVKAHYETTGPEIWKQTEGRVRWFVAGYGTTGTVTGVGRYLKEQDPSIQVVAIEPQRGHRIPGLRNFEEAKVPEILDRSTIDHVVRVNDEPAYEMTKKIWREEGLMVGPSTGAVVHAVSELETSQGDTVVGISADSGLKYVSYFSEILGDEGKPRV
jgi:cysteine synthase